MNNSIGSTAETFNKEQQTIILEEVKTPNPEGVGNEWVTSDTALVDTACSQQEKS